MHISTKNYVIRCIQKLMEQCDISIQDIQTAVDAIKHPPENNE